jgi:hypothetical protein
MERLWKSMSLQEEFDDFTGRELGFHFSRVGSVFLTLFLLRNEILVTN